MCQHYSDHNCDNFTAQTRAWAWNKSLQIINTSLGVVGSKPPFSGDMYRQLSVKCVYRCERKTGFAVLPINTPPTTTSSSPDNPKPAFEAWSQQMSHMVANPFHPQPFQVLYEGPYTSIGPFLPIANLSPMDVSCTSHSTTRRYRLR